jgi:hypothetical protein
MRMIMGTWITYILELSRVAKGEKSPAALQLIKSGETMGKELGTSPGRGRKLCPSCKMYPGVRSKICNCGHEFKPSASKKISIKVPTDITNLVEPEESDEVRVSKYNGIRGTIVLIPNGKPKHKLEGTSYDDVFNWVTKTRNDFSEGYLTTEALCYWVKYFYPYFISDDEGKCVPENTGDLVRNLIRSIDSNGEE